MFPDDGLAEFFQSFVDAAGQFSEVGIGNRLFRTGRKMRIDFIAEVLQDVAKGNIKVFLVQCITSFQGG